MTSETIAQGIISQWLASLAMLKDCMDRCPDPQWNQRHGDYPFSRVVFHTLFDVDLNLCEHEDELRAQPFHAAHRTHFGEYEELAGTIAEREYPKAFLQDYHLHCTDRCRARLHDLGDQSLLVPRSDFYRSMTKLERYINVIRHTQHHAAQLGLRLQLLTGDEMAWVGRTAVPPPLDNGGPQIVST